MANATKAKIRNLMSVLFNHAIRYEWVEQGKNPITLVRQSAKRMRNPEVLAPNEIQSLLRELNSCFRVMVILDATTGLRRSGLFALKWRDVDFSGLRLDILRSIYLGRVGNCKTEASQKPVPLDGRLAADCGFGERRVHISKLTTGFSQVLIRKGNTRSGPIPYCKRSSAPPPCGRE